MVSFVCSLTRLRLAWGTLASLPRWESLFPVQDISFREPTVQMSCYVNENTCNMLHTITFPPPQRPYCVELSSTSIVMHHPPPPCCAYPRTVAASLPPSTASPHSPSDSPCSTPRGVFTDQLLEVDDDDVAIAVSLEGTKSSETNLLRIAKRMYRHDSCSCDHPLHSRAPAAFSHF